MSEASVAIERMCYGGAGFGRVEGKACFVQLTAPGDQARIRIVKEKRSYLEGELLELTAASSLRVDPSCPFFGACGGCNWQHLPYDEQLKQKGEIFAGSLSRIGHVQSEVLLPVAPSESCYGYRSRIQLKVGRGKVGPVLGFFRNGSHDVIDIASGCAIAHPLLNRMAAELRPVLAGLPQWAAITQIDLAMGDDGQSIAILHVAGNEAAKVGERMQGAARGELPSISGLFVRSGGKARIDRVFGIDALNYTIPADLLPGSPATKLAFGRGGFSQVNYLQNLELIRTVLQWGGFTGTERVLDLYCGNGNLSIPVASRVSQVVGVEGYGPSIDDARANAELNGVANASFTVSDAALAVKRFADKGEKFDLVILDPPRSGAESAGEIARLAPKKIVYVSCDPATLSRDLALLCEKGYRVTRCRPVDMFPQTYHLESVTELTRV